MGWPVWIALAVLAAPGGENLLANPGFEELVVDRPARWDLFVLPQDGAFGRLDDTAHAGKHAVMLHTPLPYKKDPMNNWSQNIIAGLGGQRLQISGYIRVEEATEAALWVQCWRKRPWGVLRAVSTSEDAAIYGTRDWERVEATLDVPPGTAFLMLRCVLKGVGTAWFDDIEVTVLSKDQDTEQDGDEGAAAPGKPMKNEEAPGKKVSSSPLVAPDGERRKAAPAFSEPTRSVARMGSEVARLRDANVLLAEELDRMNGTNAELMEQMLLLQEQLRTIEQAMRQPMPEKPAAEAPAEPPVRVPPLVPHGEDWRQYR